MFAAGFSDPVHDAQRSFRAILDALAGPGSIHDLPLPEALDHVIPAELVSALLTLCDHDTPIWLADGYRRHEVEQFVGFHTGAPLVQAPGAAQFAFAPSTSLPGLAEFNAGTQEYPDRSTTVVLAVPSLAGGTRLLLSGPGIETHREISPEGLPANFVGQWAANRELFPRGIDLLLVAAGKVMGLPRTVRIEELD